MKKNRILKLLFAALISVNLCSCDTENYSISETSKVTEKVEDATITSADSSSENAETTESDVVEESSVTTTVTNEITTVTEAETVTTAESTVVITKNPMDYIDVTNVNIDLSSCVYDGITPYSIVNDNVPQFEVVEHEYQSFEYYSDLDSLGRCGLTMSVVGKDIMPTEERGNIGSVKPTGWQTVKYDCVDGKYLYNRCHLLGYQLTGENANTSNLITGTRYMNVDGMLPFENMVADYIKETGNHVLYVVKPVFEGDNLLATGVIMQAKSLEDNGDGILFNVFCHNVQPGIEIDYASGSSNEVIIETEPVIVETESVIETEPEAVTEPEYVGKEYILNTNTKKVHRPGCGSINQMKEENKQSYTGSLADLESQGYVGCKKCNPT